jgi:UDPglucose 6-dehydrogenase
LPEAERFFDNGVTGDRDAMMRVCVYGLWHLGCVTAACLARAGHMIVGLDPNVATVAALRRGEPPIFEPGLAELSRAEQAAGRLRFEHDLSSAGAADIVWITFDTPVDDDDRPQPMLVIDSVVGLLEHITDGSLVLISSQLPVGSTRRLAKIGAERGRRISFGYAPENLRLGRAIEVFSRPDRFVVGLEMGTDKARIKELLVPFTENIVWMGLEAAEMTKHAINAFLATSVAFMNEVASICESVGADAKEVERGLKSEERIGPSAYLSPGGAFAGGTLARDVATLAGLRPELVLIPAVEASNRRHRSWEIGKLRERYPTLAGREIAILGLTYKPGTDTLRRSPGVELAFALSREEARVRAFDPVIRTLPDEIAPHIKLAESAELALRSADAVVLATAWPEFRSLEWDRLLATMRDPTVIDPNWSMSHILREHPTVSYAAVGLPWRHH